MATDLATPTKTTNSPEEKRFGPPPGAEGYFPNESNFERGGSSDSTFDSATQFLSGTAEYTTSGLFNPALRIMNEAPAAFGESLGGLTNMVLNGEGLTESRPPSPIGRERQTQIDIGAHNRLLATRQTLEAGAQTVGMKKEVSEDERAGVGGMSTQQKSEAAGMQGAASDSRLVDNASTRTFIGLRLLWGRAKERVNKAFGIFNERIKKMGNNLLRADANEGNSMVSSAAAVRGAA